MQEELITLKIAKLAKKVGFYCKVYKQYSPGLEQVQYTDHSVECAFGGQCSLNYPEDKCFAAPPQSLLHAWIREKHDMYIAVKKGVGSEIWWSFQIIKISTNNLLYDHNRSFDSYEKSLEKGLEKALKIIKR